MQTIKKFIFIFGVLWLPFLSGCTKEDFTLPASVNLQFSSTDSLVMDKSLTLQGLSFNLTSIEIDGRRSVGGDIFQSKGLPDGLRVQIQGGSAKEQVPLTLPQGVYDRLSLVLKYQSDAREADLDEDFDDWLSDVREGKESTQDLQEDLGDLIEAYLKEVNPSILLKGRYGRNQLSYQVIFAVNDVLSVKAVSKNQKGGQEITLKKGITNTGVVEFDLAYWFSVVSPAMLEKAFIGELDGVKYIFIHKKINPDLFTAIYNRIEESTFIQVKE